MKAASEGAMKGVLGYTTDEVVSNDFVVKPALPYSTPRLVSS